MAVTNYYCIKGHIIGESASGVRTDYLTDALGSVTGTVNQSGVVINTYRYKPYGDLLSKTGTGADPAFGWVGTQGYKQTQKNFSNFYVRARHYGSAQGRWTTVDPIRFDGGDWNLYRYCANRVPNFRDPSGLDPIDLGDINQRIDFICRIMSGITGQDSSSSDLYDKINSCLQASEPRCLPQNRLTRKTALCVQGIACNRNRNINFNPVSCCPRGVHDGDCAWVDSPGLKMGGCLNNPHTPTINICASVDSPACNSFGTPNGVAQTILHEMLHCCGIKHGPKEEPNTCNSILACCIFTAIGLNPDSTRCKL